MPLDFEFSRFRSGADFVTAKCDLDRQRDQLPNWTNFLIIEDNESDARVIRGILHSWLGYDINVRFAATFGGAIDELTISVPDVMFLDHRLPPVNDAVKLMPRLRELGYQGPIIVISGKISPQMRGSFIRAGASDAIHKDDLNSMSVGQSLAKIAGIKINE